MDELHRLQLDISQKLLQRIDVVKERIDAGTRAEVVRRALHLLDMVTAGDGAVILRDADGHERVVVLA